MSCGNTDLVKLVTKVSHYSPTSPIFNRGTVSDKHNYVQYVSGTKQTGISNQLATCANPSIHNLVRSILWYNDPETEES